MTNICIALSQQHHVTEPVELDKLGNQTCPPNITGLDKLVDITIDISDQCTVESGSVCNVNPGSFCLTTIVGFVNKVS